MNSREIAAQLVCAALASKSLVLNGPTTAAQAESLVTAFNTVLAAVKKAEAEKNS